MINLFRTHYKSVNRFRIERGHQFITTSDLSNLNSDYVLIKTFGLTAFDMPDAYEHIGEFKDLKHLTENMKDLFPEEFV